MNYDKIAIRYNIYGKQAITDWALGYNNVIKLLAPVKGKRILDFGCGTGKFSRFLRDKGANVVGIDLSKSMIDLAKKESPKTIDYYLVSPSSKQRLGKTLFNAAVLNFVTCTFKSKSRIINTLKKINRALKIKDYFWSKEDYISMLKTAGFKITEILEPKAQGAKYQWIDEKKCSPFLIIVGKKQ